MHQSIVSIVFSLILFSAAHLNAQIQLGVRVGVARTAVKINSTKSDAVSGLVLGAPVIIPLGQFVDIQTGFEFIERGMKRSNRKSKFFYAEIPVLLRPGGEFGGVSIHGIIGPSFNFGLSKSFLFNAGDNLEWSVSNRKRFETGGRLGIQVGIPTEKSEFYVDLRYRFGLSNLQKVDAFVSQRQISSGFDLGLNWVFDLKKSSGEASWR